MSFEQCWLALFLPQIRIERKNGHEPECRTWICRENGTTDGHRSESIAKNGELAHSVNLKTALEDQQENAEQTEAEESISLVLRYLRYLLPQPIRLSVQPVKVRRWELTMNPSSHNRRSDGVTRHRASSVVKVPGQSRASQRDGPQHQANAAASLNGLWTFWFPQQRGCRATQEMAKATWVPKASSDARTQTTGVRATARAQGLTE